jgi:hypothetical protein
MKILMQTLAQAMGVDQAAMQYAMEVNGHLSDPKKNRPEAPIGSCKLAYFDNNGAKKGSLSDLWQKEKVRHTNCSAV